MGTGAAGNPAPASAAAAGGISFADLLLPLLGAAAVGAGVGYAAGNSNDDLNGSKPLNHEKRTPG